ncbi:MAG: DNA mismatch repair endonuclease MutL [Myxococcales bacterium]|nr:DNA mismatch repair endonuclease MutL [Myxococcales bacterium]
MTAAASPPSGQRIVLLDPVVANQIAAGEVVERPASVVKELVENALDSGATRVTIRLEDGGKLLVRVTDNGCGMSPADARLAFARHATSKLVSAEDLQSIATFGFRGEALASILAVARVSLSTRRLQDDVGVRLTGAGSVDLDQGPVGCATGTDIAVEELFFNVPARLKFLRTASTETGRVLDFVETLALGRRDLHLTLWVGTKKVLDFPPDNDDMSRAHAVLGGGIAKRLYAVAGQGEYAVKGLLSEPSLFHSGAGQLRILVNDRPISDRTLQQAVLQSYGTLLERGKYPIGILWLQCPAGSVDVNVHPAKSEVRFASQANVFGAVVHAIRDMLSHTPWIRDHLPSRSVYSTADGAAPEQTSAIHQSAFGAVLQSAYGAGPRQQSGAINGSWPLSPTQASAPSGAKSALAPVAPLPVNPYPPLPLAEPAVGQWAGLRYVGQVANCYLVCQDTTAMVIIDQHAAHERVLFERFVVALRTGALPTQALLIPLAVPLSPAEVAAITDESELVHRLGFDITAAGPRLVRVLAHAALLREADVAAQVRELAASLLAGGRGQAVETRIERHAATLACHAAFRGGDVLHLPDVQHLLAQMDGVDLAAYCPHGRPVWTRVKFDDIGRWFGRP